MRYRNRLLLAGVLLAAFPGCKWAATQISEGVRYVARWANGVPKKEGTLTAGIQTGPWTFYYADGRKRSQGTYADDRQVGAWTSWYENGNTEWQGSFDDAGLRTGAWTFYHDNGTCRARGRFRADREHGFWQFFDRDGCMQNGGDFAVGRRSGLWTYYHAAGSKQAQGLCFEGAPVGPWRLWSTDGVASASALPLPKGCELVAETWPDGALRRLGLLRDGQPVGAFATWHDNGAVRAHAEMGSAKDAIAWSIFANDGSLRADGLLVGNDLVDWRSWRGATATAEDRTPLPQLPPATPGEFGPASLADGASPAVAVATYLRELRAPASATVAPLVAPGVPVSPPAQVEVLSTKRIAPKWQPSWTVTEEEELGNYVQDYLVGKAPARTSRKRYEVPKAAQGKPRRRADLENKSLALDELKVTDGSVVRLADLAGKRRALIVILRGFAGQVCVYCVAQTEALAQCADSFAELNMDVFVIYPGPEGDEAAFLQAYEESFGKGAPPYKICYDPDLALVERLGVAGGDLAYPTTIFLDEQGVVRYAYTGQTRADRPAAQEILKFVRSLKKP